MSIGNSPEDDRPSIGRALQQARLDAGLTVEEISGLTRVRAPVVDGIEHDDFTRCGGDVYARGHIRVLARAVGVDPEPLVERYDAEHGGRPEPTPAAALFEAERVRPEARRPNWTAAMVAAIVAVVGFVGFTLFSGGHDGGSPVAKDSASPKPTSAQPSPSGSTGGPAGQPGQGGPTDSTPDPSDSAIAGVPGDQVTVTLIADSGQSWVSVHDHNGRVLQEGVLQQGQSKTFRDDKRIDLLLGNAGAVKVFVNGKQVKDVGNNGQVERLSYTKGDPEQG